MQVGQKQQVTNIEKTTTKAQPKATTVVNINTPSQLNTADNLKLFNNTANKATQFSLFNITDMKAVVAVRDKTEVVVQKSAATFELEKLATKYNVTIAPGDTVANNQQKIIKQIVKVKAKEMGIPEAVAIGMVGHESGWTMWKNVDQSTLINCPNKKNGKLLSTDWGAMQVNDKAHPEVFPKVKKDVEANIEFGLQYLKWNRNSAKGSMNIGFGDWDKTIASYNLGHKPVNDNDMSIALPYLKRVRSMAKEAGYAVAPAPPKKVVTTTAKNP